MLAELERCRQESEENRHKHEMSQGYPRELVLYDRTAKEVPAAPRHAASIGAECVENDGGCVANDCGNLNSKWVVTQVHESDAAYHHDQVDQGEDKEAFKRKGRGDATRVKPDRTSQLRRCHAAHLSALLSASYAD